MRRLAYAQAAMPDMLAIGRALLATQPFNAVLGAELASFSEGRAELRLRITDQLKQQNGFVHGGVIGCAADNAISSTAARAAANSLRRMASWLTDPSK